MCPTNSHWFERQHRVRNPLPYLDLIWGLDFGLPISFVSISSLHRPPSALMPDIWVWERGRGWLLLWGGTKRQREEGEGSGVFRFYTSQALEKDLQMFLKINILFTSASLSQILLDLKYLLSIKKDLPNIFYCYLTWNIKQKQFLPAPCASSYIVFKPLKMKNIF